MFYDLCNYIDNKVLFSSMGREVGSQTADSDTVCKSDQARKTALYCKTVQAVKNTKCIVT